MPEYNTMAFNISVTELQKYETFHKRSPTLRSVYKMWDTAFPLQLYKTWIAGIGFIWSICNISNIELSL